MHAALNQVLYRGKELFTSADSYVPSMWSSVLQGSPMRQRIMAAVLCIDRVLKQSTDWISQLVKRPQAGRAKTRLAQGMSSTTDSQARTHRRRGQKPLSSSSYSAGTFLDFSGCPLVGK